MVNTAYLEKEIQYKVSESVVSVSKDLIISLCKMLSDIQHLFRVEVGFTSLMKTFRMGVIQLLLVWKCNTNYQKNTEIANMNL